MIRNTLLTLAALAFSIMAVQAGLFDEEGVTTEALFDGGHIEING